MIDKKVHGTDCFEVDSFLQRNGFSKLYHVRHKENGRFYTMEVSPRDVNSKAPVSPYVQLTKTILSPSWVSLRFTFQTRSKFYYILDFPGKQTLSERVKSCGGYIPESVARFYAAEIAIALEEFHNSFLAYKDLALDMVYLDSEGHVVLWRSFCGKFYWSKHECVCSLGGFCHGDPCDNNHNLKGDFDFQEDWKALGKVINAMLAGDDYPRSSKDRSLSAAASDLISRLVRGDISRSDQIQSHPFFKGINWHEIKTRKARPPMSSEKGPTSFPSQTNSAASYSSVEANTSNGPSSFYRPHSLSFYSDPGDTRYLKSAPDYMVPRPSLHSAVSTPDLRSLGRESPFLHHHTSLPARDMRYHYGNLDYASARARDSQPSPERGVEGRRIFASRSLSDLSTFDGNDSVFHSHSPTSLQRNFVYPNYEGVPHYTKTFYPPSDNSQGICNGEYSFRSSGSSPDLTSSFSAVISQYHTPHSGRSSPTPSQYSDYSSSYSTESSPRGGYTSPYQTPRSRYSDDGVSPRENGGQLGLRRWERSLSRESENHRGSSESSNSFQRGKSPQPARETREFNYSSSPSKIATYKSSTQPRPLQDSDFTRGNDTNRTSNDVGRERSSTLSRTLSLSNLGDEQKRTVPKAVSEKRRDSLPLADSGAREKYPLARVPIPSFREFKQKNLEEDSKNKTSVGRNEVKEKQSGRSTKEESKHESKTKAEMRASLKERLSSLYESAKDISAQNSTKRIGDSHTVSSWEKTKKEKVEKSFIAAKSTDLTEEKPSNSTDGKVLEKSRKISKGRHESPFSKNEVIHNLMLKYGLYEKGGHKKNKSPKNEIKQTVPSPDTTHLDEKERNSNNEMRLKNLISDVKSQNSSSPSKRTISPAGKERSAQEAENNLRNATDSNRPTPRSSPLSARKSVQGITTESKKSAAERFRELRRQNGLRNRSSDDADVKNQGQSKELNSSDISTIKDTPSKESLKRDDDESGFFDRHNTGEIRRNDLDSTVTNTIRPKSNVLKNMIMIDEISANQNVATDLNTNPVSSSKEKSKIGFRGTSRAILCATKFKRATNKGLSTPNGSPLPDKKQLGDIIAKSDVAAKVESPEPQNESPMDAIEIKRNEPVGKRSPNTRRRRFRMDGKLRKGGIHTSMLSVASSTCLTDSEMEDTVSICSEMDSLDDERGTRGRRWESFHSNISADSGSAHLFEFETDSNTTEFDEVFDDQESGDEHPKGEVEVERTDSGVGGDMGQSPLRRSWEEIVMKSSEHWSVVAASARHWQELARRRKANESETTAVKKRSSVHSITEDMVECPDCLKHYVPPKEEEKGTGNTNEPEICPKCKDRKVERKEAIIELVQTEINYGNDLQILKEEFYLPMQSGGILSPENLAAIFLNLQELLEVNSKFCAKLQKSLEESVAKGDEEFSNVNVGSIFLESVDFFQAYEIYCSKQTAASALLESLQKKTELLRIFLNVTCRENPKCRKMDLNSFILAPVQRIMKYPLLLSRICKASPRRNPDREKLKLAQRRIEEQLNKINALNTAVESRQRRYRASQQLGRSESLDKLQMKKMASDILNWTMEEMQLLMHGVFQITIHEFGASWNRRGSKKAMSVCALFCVRGHSELVRIDSDDEGECEEPLFPGEGEVTDAAVVLLRKKMSGKYTLFKEPLFLDMCVVYRDCARKDAFEIMSIGKETYVFRASTSREYRRWLKYLRLEAKELGAWKRRRNGLPNIMIKNL